MQQNLFLLPAFAFIVAVSSGPVRSAEAQSTGSGVTLPNPTPREPDPRDVLRVDGTESDPHPQQTKALRAERQMELLGECNEILLLSHQLHVQLLEHKQQMGVPANAAMTQKIAKLARKLQDNLK